MARNSKGGWLLYVMVAIPWIWWVKIGITHVGIGALKRAFSIDKAMIGFPVPIMVVPLPGAYHFEQAIHAKLKRLSFRFYKGDGASEWFWAFAAIFVLPVMLSIWGIYACLLDMVLGTTIAPVLIETFFDCLFWVVANLIELFKTILEK